MFKVNKPHHRTIKMPKIILLLGITLLLSACAGGRLDIDYFPPRMAYTFNPVESFSDIKDLFTEPKHAGIDVIQKRARSIATNEYYKLITEARNASENGKIYEGIVKARAATYIEPQKREAYDLECDLRKKINLTC